MTSIEGSCRTIQFNYNATDIILDNIKTQIQTVTKISKYHQFDTEAQISFGCLQNKIESNPRNLEYSVLVKVDGKYTTNDSGILATVLGFDLDNTKLEMVKIAPITIQDFKQLTITPIYLTGLVFNEVVDAIKRAFVEHTSKPELLGYFKSTLTDQHFQLVISHPWVKKYIEWMLLVENNPCDFTLKNLGKFTHPLSNKEYLVLCDYGFSNEYMLKFYDNFTRNY